MDRSRSFVTSKISNWIGPVPIDRPIPPETTFVGDGSDGDVTISANTSLTVPNKSGSYDGDPVIMQYNSLTVNSGATLTTDQPCRGLWIFVKGDCTIDGSISMTGRGPFANPNNSGSSDNSAVSAEGWKYSILNPNGSSSSYSYQENISDLNGLGNEIKTIFSDVSYSDGNIETLVIPKNGAAGAPTGFDSGPGISGGDANGTTTFAGGGGGGGRGNGGSTIGAGGLASCFGGGSGSGAARATTSAAAPPYGGRGGNAATSCLSCRGGGGAGNPGGSGSNGGGSGSNGTGGFIVLTVGGNLLISDTGSISANGLTGGNSSVVSGYTSEGGGGGGSGGGFIIAAVKGTYTNNGNIEYSGGSGGVHSGANNPGGRGGNGSFIFRAIL